MLLEQFTPGHDRGSSHGSARIFRRAYPDPLYVRLTGQVQPLWRELADEAGEELITTTGAVDYGPARVAILRQIAVQAQLDPPAIFLVGQGSLYGTVGSGLTWQPNVQGYIPVVNVSYTP